VDDTRPGTAAGDNFNNQPNDGPVHGGPGTGTGTGVGNPRGGSNAAADAPRSAFPPEDEQEEEETGAVVPQVPQTLVQFLLVSGRRRSMAFDPETTVGRVKELVWNTWPNGTLSFAAAFPLSTQAHMYMVALLHLIAHKMCRGGDLTRLPSQLSFSFIQFFIFIFILLRTKL
jgi:hypothetical protein